MCGCLPFSSVATTIPMARFEDTRLAMIELIVESGINAVCADALDQGDESSTAHARATGTSDAGFIWCDIIWVGLRVLASRQ